MGGGGEKGGERVTENELGLGTGRGGGGGEKCSFETSNHHQTSLDE